VWDFVQSVVGEADDVQSRLQLQRPDVKIRDPATNTITATIKSDVPDLITVIASLRGSEVTRDGATLLVRFRRGQSFPGEPPLTWNITGEKGEIRLVAPGGPSLQVHADALPVEIHDFETNEVQQASWDWEDWQEELPVSSRNVGALYEAFADGNKYATFQDALRRHEQLDQMLRGWIAERG
jgi:hypothetical protein